MPAKKKKADAAAAKETAAPQTETNPELDEMIAAEGSENSDSEAASPQTEIETAENAAIAQEFSDNEAEKTSLPQTEMDSEKKDPDHAEFDINQEEKTAAPQTDIETEEKTAIAAEDGVEGDKKTTIPQTDTEKEADEPEEIPGRAHNPDNPQNQSESDTDEANKRADNTAAPRTRRRSIGISRTGSVLAIDDSITVETEADRARNDLLDLLESQKSKRILSGTLQGIERPEDNPKRSLAVIYHGDYKVIIPVEELIEPPQDYRGMQPEDVMHYLLQGYTIYTCPDCGKEYIGDEKESIDHNYTAVVTKPTCTELGYTTYTCADCGETHKSDYIEATGHKLSGWIVDTPATIENAGSKHIECETCKTVLKTAEIPKLINKDNSDEDGHSKVGNYSILITDKNNKPVFDSEVGIDKNDNITIKLPDGRLLSVDDITTITVTRTETQKPVQDVNIFIADHMNNAATGKTDENGQLKVPNKQSSTGNTSSASDMCRHQLCIRSARAYESGNKRR